MEVRLDKDFCAKISTNKVALTMKGVYIVIYDYILNKYYIAQRQLKTYNV